MPGGQLGLLIRIGGDVAGLKKALGEADQGISVFGKTVSAKGVGQVAALAGAAGIAVTAITAMTMAASADRDEADALAASIARATGSTEDYTAATDAAIAAGQAKAFTDSETRAALDPLVRSTGDMALATEQLAFVQDLARASNVDLATAADAVAKANEGQDTALRKLLPGLQAGTDATETLGNAQKATAGAADVFAKSTKGQMAIAGDSFSELTETIGEVFLPILDAIIPVLIPILKAFGELVKSLLPLLIPLIKVLGSVLGVVAKVLVAVVDAIVSFVKWIAKAINDLGKFLDQLPLIGDVTRAIGGIGRATGGAVGATASAGGLSAAPRAAPGANVPGSGFTIQITGDPLTIEREVVRVLRTYGRRQGRVISGLVDAGSF